VTQQLATLSPDRSRCSLPLWARATDLIAIALLGVGVYVSIHGGFVFRTLGVRIALRSGWRVLAWAVVVMAVRHALVRHSPIHRRIVRGLRALAVPALNYDDLATAAENDGVEKGRTWRRTAGYGVAVIALFAALTVLMTYPQVRMLGTGVTPDRGDPLLSTWRLAWFAHELPRDPRHLFDANIFYPERFTLAYSDAMLVPSLTVAPLVWLGVHQLLAYNLLLLSGFALSGAAMFLLVRSLTGHAGAALVAGFVFAFLPYRYMHYAHLELQMAQWMPLALWALHRTFKHGRIRDGLLMGLFFALQTLSSFYYGIFFATYLVPVGIALWAATKKELRWPSVRALAAGAALAGVLIVPFALPYFSARRAVGERPVWEIEFYSAMPRDYITAHPRNALLGGVTTKWGRQERELFQGIAVPVIAAAALWPPLSAARIGYAAGLALAFDCSLGMNGIVYPWLHEHALPYRGLRVPARMAILVGLSLAILVGYAVARLAKRFRGGGAVLTVATALVLVFIEYRPALTLEHVWTAPPPIYQALPSSESTVVLELPLIQPDIALEPTFMYFSTFKWHRLVNGYSGFQPRSYVTLNAAMRSFPDDASIAELRRRGTEFVIVHGAFYTPDEFVRVTSRIGRRPEFEFVSKLQWEGRETRLYRLSPEPVVPSSDVASIVTPTNSGRPATK
jgi:hypothetical protein